MKISTRGVVIGALGVGLLAGGSTFALWSASTTVNAGTITSGTLDVATVDNAVWTDVSAPAAPVVIADAAAFLTVPGDQITRTQDITVELTGDNIAAELTATSQALTGGLASPTEGLTATYTLLDATRAEVAAPVALGQPLDAAVEAGTYTVQITLDFDINTPDTVRQNVAAELGAVEFTLTQTR